MRDASGRTEQYSNYMSIRNTLVATGVVSSVCLGLWQENVFAGLFLLTLLLCLCLAKLLALAMEEGHQGVRDE